MNTELEKALEHLEKAMEILYVNRQLALWDNLRESVAALSNKIELNKGD